MISGIILGILMIIAVYYIIMYLFIRETSYLYYILFILSFGLFFLRETGYFDEFVRSHEIFFMFKFRSLIFILPFIFYILFGINYLSLKKTHKIWYGIALAVLLIISVPTIIKLIWGLFHGIYTPYPHYFSVLTTITLITLIVSGILMIITAILRIIHRFRAGWHFLLATILMIGFFVLNALVIPDVYISDISTAISNSSLYFGVIAQFLILSIGLGQKIRATELEKKKAQERMIEQLKENEKLKDKVNRELEQKVAERTQEIQMQKEEIATQRDELERQRDVVTHQKEELTDSIMYASRIQNAVLPTEDLLEELLPEHFVLFRPRDLVSGDFYWIRQIKHFTVVVAADCTGHGVPDAFMSMLGISFLNEIVSRSRFDNAGEFLDRLRKKVKDTLKQEGKIFEQKDGMDISLAIIDSETGDLQYAGAFNPLFIIRSKTIDLDDHLAGLVIMASEEHNLIEIKGDNQPIAIHEKESDFLTHQLKLEKGDTLYIFSDGYADQMGGPKGKKFMIKKFKQMLLDIQPESLAKQKDILDNTIQNWKGDIEQIDDILVFGIRWK